MASNDIEYHIKFPYNTAKPNSPAGDDDFVYICKDEKCPVVVLLGWIGCKDKHLARYSEIYDERGCITVRCCVPLSELMFHHNRYPQLAEKLLNLIRDMSLDEHPVFFHIFSNGGCYMYQYIVNEINMREFPIDFRGCIVDSAPGKLNSSSVYKTISQMPMGSKPVRVAFALFACVWMYLLNLVMLALHHFVDKKYLSGDVYKNLMKAPSGTPYHFIYSADDKFIEVNDIDEFVAERRKLGTAVSTCRFDSSPHVMHLLTHRDAYIESIDNFLRSCLQAK